MTFRVKGFTIGFTYPTLAFLSILLISGTLSGYAYCFAALTIHELGHLFMMKLCGAEPSGINVSLFDIKIIQRSRHSLSFVRDALIILAGPAANLIMFALFFPFCAVFSAVNLMLGAFNLLPASGVDGGQLLFLILLRRFGARKSALITDITTVAVCVPMFFVGLTVLLYSKYNFSLLFLSLYLILTVFMREDKYL